MYSLTILEKKTQKTIILVAYIFRIDFPFIFIYDGKLFITADTGENYN